MRAFDRVRLTLTTVRNWPLVVLDRSGLVARPRYRLYSGLTFECRSKTSDLAEVVVVCSGHEYPVELISNLRDGAVVLDVGANIGAFCAFVHLHNPGTRYKGFAFEPFTANVSLLEANLAANGISEFEVVEAAVSGIDGTVHLDVDCPPDEVSVATKPTGTESLSVRLSSFCRERGLSRIDVLKLDVEGHEYDILDADLPFLAAHVSTLLLEFHRMDDRDGEEWVSDRLRPAFDVDVFRTEGGSGIITGRHRGALAQPCT